MLSLPSKHAADTWQMGNYAAQDPCLLLSVSCGKGGQKLDLKWLPGGGRAAEAVLGLCSPKLPCAGGREMGSTGFLCWAACLHGVVFEGCSDDLPAMASPCRDRAGPAAGEPLWSEDAFAWCLGSCGVSAICAAALCSTKHMLLRINHLSALRDPWLSNLFIFFLVSSPQCLQCQTTSSPCQSQNGCRQYRPT